MAFRERQAGLGTSTVTGCTVSKLRKGKKLMDIRPRHLHFAPDDVRQFVENWMLMEPPPAIARTAVAAFAGSLDSDINNNIGSRRNHRAFPRPGRT